MNLISLAYARKRGFSIEKFEDYEKVITFADGSCSLLSGKVFLWMRFADGEGPQDDKPFYVLENLTSHVLLGFDLTKLRLSNHTDTISWWSKEHRSSPS